MSCTSPPVRGVVLGQLLFYIDGRFNRMTSLVSEIHLRGACALYARRMQISVAGGTK